MHRDGRCTFVRTRTRVRNEASSSIVANRIILVGDFERCKLLGEQLTHVKVIESRRRLHTLTGLYGNMPISIMCGGMVLKLRTLIGRLDC